VGLVATQQTFPPGSTFKVITTQRSWCPCPNCCSALPQCRYDQLAQHQQDVVDSALESAEGPSLKCCRLRVTPVSHWWVSTSGHRPSLAADSFGYDEIPPIDLPGAVATIFPRRRSSHSTCPASRTRIGQQDVRTSALQNALVAAAVGNGGVMMTPHLLNYVTGPDGTIVKRYKPTVWKTPLTLAQAIRLCRSWWTLRSMAQRRAFFPRRTTWAPRPAPPKSATARRTPTTDDRLRAGERSDNRRRGRVTVSSHFGDRRLSGRTVMRCLVEGALAIQSHQPFTMTGSTVLATPLHA